VNERQLGIDKIKKRERKEDVFVRDPLKRYLEVRGWKVKIIHGGKFQYGLPDLYATHKRYGPRWIECKLPRMQGSQFTKAQLEWLPIMDANGSPVWVLTAANEHEYKKLFKKSNLTEMMLMTI
jgi:hypothetical protein